MNTRTQTEQVRSEQVQSETHIPRWSVAARVAFRFCFAYLGLFCIATQALYVLYPSIDVDSRNLGTIWPMRQITFWTAVHIFHVKSPLVYKSSGSGDKTFDWVLTLCLVIFAVFATGIWSVLDRKRQHYVPSHKWFRLFIRFSLAGQMFFYGMAKAIPVQMPFPSLWTLVQPFGNFFPMGVLWSSIGTSPAYEIFTGCAEVLGGMLLVIPRLTTLGALICLADLVQVFVLNMTYQVPVKLFSFHLLLMSLLLLTPEVRRLADFFLLNRAAEPSTQVRLFSTPRANRIALAVQIVFGIWLLGISAHISWTFWHADRALKSPLYGIWDVDQLSIDGQRRSPLLTDYEYWRRAIFDSPSAVVFQRIDDSLTSYNASINLNDNTLELTKRSDRNQKGKLTFQRERQDELALDGEMDGHKIAMRLRLVDPKKFRLLQCGFHWIQEYPYTC